MKKLLMVLILFFAAQALSATKTELYQQPTGTRAECTGTALIMSSVVSLTSLLGAVIVVAAPEKKLHWKRRLLLLSIAMTGVFGGALIDFQCEEKFNCLK